MTYRTGTRGGKSNKTVTVTTNDPDQRTVKLTMSAEVHVALAAEPYIINFGRIKKGEAPVRYIAITGDDKEKTKITSVASKNKDIKVETNPEGYENTKDKKVKVSLQKGMKAGQFRDTITIATDHKDIKTINVNVFGEVMGDITVIPRSFSFGFFEKGKAPEKVITLKANPPATVKVLKAEASSPDVNVEVVPVTEGKEYQIKARLQEQFDSDILRGQITVTTDSKEQPTIEVRYFGRMQKAGVRSPAPKPQAIQPSPAKQSGAPGAQTK